MKTHTYKDLLYALAACMADYGGGDICHENGDPISDDEISAMTEEEAENAFYDNGGDEDEIADYLAAMEEE